MTENTTNTVRRYNPATRLHRLLTEANRRSDKIRTDEVWVEVLNCPPNPDEEDRKRTAYDAVVLTDRMRALQQLYIDTSRLVDRYVDDNNQALYRRSLPSIHTAIAVVQLSQNWGSCKNLIGEKVLADLEHTAEFLRSKGHHDIPEDEITRLSEGNLADLDREAAELFSLIEDSELDEYLRDYLLANIDNIRRAIAEFRIRGIEGLRQAVDEGMGVLYRTVSHYRREKTTPSATVKERLIKTIELFSHVETVIATASRLPQIAQFATKLIEEL